MEVRKMAGEKKVLGWGSIIAIMLGVAIAMGLALGLTSRALGVSSGVAAGGVGATIGALGAMLIARRRADLERQKNG
jgi:membrane associated rhomboid family serine protease